MTGSHDQPSSAADFAQLARFLAETPGVLPTVRGVVLTAVRSVPCDWAAVAVTDELTQRPARLAASNDEELAVRIGTIAAAAGSSPGIAAFDQDRIVACPDLTREQQFDAYAQRMLAQTDVRSVLSLPLHLHNERVGVMTLYAARPEAFPLDAVERAQVISDHAVIAIESARAEDQAVNLEAALRTSRSIGMALGILMERHKMTQDAAFEKLRDASQHTNRKLYELAADLVETGAADGILDDGTTPPDP
jgi:GAF domain-containing protein